MLPMWKFSYLLVHKEIPRLGRQEPALAECTAEWFLSGNVNVAHLMRHFLYREVRKG